MNDTPLDPKHELRQAIIHQKTANMPDEPETEDLALLHAYLHEYDTYVSEVVIQVLQGAKVAGTFSDADKLDQELEKAFQLSDPVASRAIRKYQAYKDRLDRMLELARATSTSDN